MSNAFTPIKLKGDGDRQIVRGQAAGHADAHRQDHKELAPFAPLRQNNSVECFTTGKDFFEALSKKMKAAKKCIFIAGWQVNWDVELVPGERLIDILHDCIKSSPEFRVYVMPWLSPKVGVNTGDLDTMLAIFQLNAGLKNMQAMCCPAGAQSDYVGTEGAAFSHHQKMIVIDNKTAYIGGMDLAYGRYDDNSFSLDPGKRSFNERYNPGVPGNKSIDHRDGRALSMLDLLTTTLTAGTWNAGGNTEPGAVSEFIEKVWLPTKKLTLDAVSLVNQFSRNQMDAEVAALKATAKGTKQAAVASADAAVAAGKALSRQCAAMQIPDIYGGIKSLNISAEPTSSIPGKLRKVEADAREGWNSGVDELTKFLSPASYLRVDPKPQSILPATLELSERVDRFAYNTFINGAAAVGSVAQYAANAERDVCIGIGPVVESGANHAKTAGRQAQAAVGVGMNILQQAIIQGINEVRTLLNEQVLAIIALGDHGLDVALQNLSQQNVQALLDRFMRLAKVIYTSQLAISWAHATAHPFLLQKGTKAAASKVLGSGQPREPWQDVHVQIEGPSVDDVAMNFIGRWNACQNSYLSDKTMTDMLPKHLTDKDSYANLIGTVARKSMFIDGDFVPPPRPSGAAEKRSGVAVRVLRSAPLKLCKQEALSRRDKTSPVKEQHEIQDQMITLINAATDFIYIENQFYQTEFGLPSIDVFTRAAEQLVSAPMRYMIGQRANRLTAEVSSAGFEPGKKLLPSNGIGKALADRIAQAIRHDQPFHVYLVLPVHPEGRLNDITVVGQIHWTMQSLVFADHSLVNSIKRAIAAKKICKKPLNKDAWDASLKIAGKVVNNKAPYQNIPDMAWGEYLTLLNLRNCEVVSGKVRTEQIYIHSKLLIVDDRHVIVGSANINDRSQSGKRDSEIAVMLLDNSQEKKTIGKNVTHVNTLARKLRVDIWKKHFALSAEKTGIVEPAKSMEALIERPAAEETIKEIQSLAKYNAQAYSEAFPHIPWSIDEPPKGASIWPVCPPGISAEKAGRLSVKMPFHDDFWLPENKNSARPAQIKGFFTKLPTYWTLGENNHPGQMSVMALTMLEDDNHSSDVA
ncbi:MULTISPECIES: phospholipase D-like domain-containing protein [unclassified Duganella]|uniref:phospholipase D-like domain-containing protein n=1 Tax=unclassified Duganella TaxID=2636909 RepID=UPI000E3532FD|nr:MULTISPECIES: phospholipase D-like domain-containing protein [unclassified Duganella]RFP19334.1 hypothetical protein D0T23_06050 [Duganella sp. BJB475]RFP35915.1 hypothetical protein D0T21_05595 [Duganella sp. BJB476]